jgi:hypothetical protein
MNVRDQKPDERAVRYGSSDRQCRDRSSESARVMELNADRTFCEIHGQDTRWFTEDFRVRRVPR